MHHWMFEEIVELQFTRCREVLIVKAAEYADDEDRLRNFKLAAKLEDCTTMVALRGMMTKHTISIYAMLNSPTSYPMSIWDEKITDNINYLLLLKATLEDESLDTPASLKGTHQE